MIPGRIMTAGCEQKGVIGGMQRVVAMPVGVGIFDRARVVVVLGRFAGELVQKRIHVLFQREH